MTRIVRLLTRSAFLLAVVAPALAAQETKKPSEHGSHDAHAAHAAHAAKPALDAELGQHFKGIDLTEEQVKQVVAIKAKHHKAMDALRKDAKDPSDPKLKVEIQKHMDAEHAEFMALLTPEQKKTFMENMKDHHKAETKKP